MIVHDRLAATRACLDSLRATDEPFALKVITSAERRARVQLPQNGWVTEEMMPISPAPSR